MDPALGEPRVRLHRVETFAVEDQASRSFSSSSFVLHFSAFAEFPSLLCPTGATT
jgi:hypothetical protein